MKAAIVTKQGQPIASNIAFVDDWPEPDAPGPGQALIRTEASAFNHMDLWIGAGLPGHELTYPRIGGADGCGKVEAVGPGVDESWLGRRVVVNAATPKPERTHPDDPPGTTLAPSYKLLGESVDGMHRERFVAKVAQLADVGDADPCRAAACGLVALTAYSMMFTKGQLRPGQLVLITGIGGGVATAALGLGKHLGCTICVTSRHQWKLDRALELGAHYAILDGGQDWSRDARAFTNKRGFDMAVDSIGKATHLWCIKSLARGGAYVTPGCTSGSDATTDLARIFWNQLRVLGSTMGSPDEFREVIALFTTGRIEPVVDTVYAACDAAKAVAKLEGAEQFGKLVLDWR